MIRTRKGYTGADRDFLLAKSQDRLKRDREICRMIGVVPVEFVPEHWRDLDRFSEVPWEIGEAQPHPL